MTRAEIYSVVANKGGVSKTTLSTNLAGSFSLDKKKVLIIDNDSQGNVSLTFALNPDNFEYTLYDVLLNDLEPKDAIQKVYKNIDILPSNDDMGYFDLDVVVDERYKNKVLQVFNERLSDLKTMYDCIIIDNPPSFGLAVGNSLNFTENGGVIIPFQPEVYSMRSLQKTIQQIENFKRRSNPDLSVKVVVGTLIDTRTSIHSQVLQECRKYCLEKGIPMSEVVIPRSIRYSNSVGFKRLPSTLAEKGKLLKENAFHKLKEEYFNGKKKARSNWFGRSSKR